MATITVTSNSLSDVQTAVNTAVTGDTVQMLSASATWVGALTISGKTITLEGAGVGNTLITESAGVPAIYNYTASRITGISFTLGGTADTQGIYVDGQDWRIDHCDFISASFKTGVWAGQASSTLIRGVIDHCNFTNCRVEATPLPSTTSTHLLWYAPSRIGSADNVFVEDNVFTFTTFSNVIDSNYGGSYVFRYNTVIDSSVEAHSTQHYQYRGTRHWEVYGNQIIQSTQAMNFTFYMRGGTGVIYNNVVSGTWTNPGGFINNVRSSESRAYIGYANGGVPHADGNTAEYSGTHGGSNGASVLTASPTQTWATNLFINADPNFNYYVYNVTDGSKGQIVSNTATTVTATLSGGTRNNWNNGDTFAITNGYPARDQPGRGADSALSVGDIVANPNTWWNPQALEPIYYWNNTFSPGGATLTLAVSGGGNAGLHMVAGRDYYTDGTQRPGYTAYTYPHPLQGVVTSPGLQGIYVRGLNGFGFGISI